MTITDIHDQSRRYVYTQIKLNEDLLSYIPVVVWADGSVTDANSGIRYSKERISAPNLLSVEYLIGCLNNPEFANRSGEISLDEIDLTCNPVRIVKPNKY